MEFEPDYMMLVKRLPMVDLFKARMEGKTVTIFNPHCDFSSGMSTRIMSIKLTQEYTRFEIKGSCNDITVDGNCLQIEAKTFMYGVVSERKYKLIKSFGVPFKPNFKGFKEGQKVYYFSLIFEPLPFFEKQIDIKETLKSKWLGPEFYFSCVDLWKKDYEYNLKDYSKS